MAGEGSAARSGAMFGDYEIIETLGQGGMGVVYRAHDVSLDRIVALKVLRDDLRSSQQICARFQREAEAFASLNHANIVHIYTVGSVGRIPFISMEYIDGHALSTIMKRQKRIEWKRAIELGLQIAEALSCAHEAHIVHRDIKPGNILVDKSDRAFVTDFGIAKVLTAETQLTLDGSRLGTPQYMSPERCLNKELTTSSDLYSLGVLVFQMITGRLPYEGSSPIELIKSIVADPPSRISDYLPEIPGDVERLVAYTIEKRPVDRPSSAIEVAELMQRLLDGEPLWEDESGLAVSLETYRSSVSTPNPSLTPHTDELGQVAQIGKGIGRQWEKVPKRFRMPLAGGAIVAAATLAGFGTAFQLNRDYAVDTVRRMDLSTESWYRSAVVADFNPESKGVDLARIQLKGYKIARPFFLGQNYVALQLNADSGGSAQLSALCVLDLSTQHAWLGITPKAGESSDAPFALLGESRNLLRIEDASVGYLFTRPTTSGSEDLGLYASLTGNGISQPPRLILRASDLQDADERSGPKNIHAAEVGPSGNSIVMAVAAKAGPPLSSLIRFTPGDGVSGRRTDVLDGEGAPIEWIASTPGDSIVRYLRRTSNTHFELRGIEESAGPGASRLIFGGTGTLSRAGIESSGRYLAVVRGVGTDAALKLIDLSNDGQETDLGPGTSAAWHPDGEHLLVTVRDRRGDMQLWAVQARAPHGRAQLTFLSEGIDGSCLVSPDGTWAIVSADDPNFPVMAVVEVSKERLAELDFSS